MINKNRLIWTLILISIVTTSITNIPISYKNNLLSDKKISNKQNYDAPINEVPTKLDNLKPAGISEEQQNHNFSFNTDITETWNQTFSFSELNSTKLNEIETEWFTLQRTKGSNMVFLFIMTNITNLTSREELYPSNFTVMKLSYFNESLVRVNISTVYDTPYGRGYGGVSQATPLKINNSNDARFVVWNDWTENTNISYNALMFINAYREYNLKTTFIPTIDNTESDFITWELKYEGHYNGIGFNPIYNASLKVEELDNFTIKNALGFDGNYWIPLDYSRNETHIFINQSFVEYKIELQTPNYLSIIFNNNLTNDANELKLYATCKISGNLTVQFKLTNGTILRESWLVQENEIKYYNYIMPLNSTGGIGYLNITLTDNSKTKFGVKVAEVLFYKKAFVWGGTGNTTAFSQLWIIAPFLDTYIWNEIGVRNFTQKLNLTIFEMINYSIIHDAIVTYEFAGIIGELEENFVPFNESGVINYVNLYFKIIDLREFLIKPGEYNITITASKMGYAFTTFVTEIIIFKQEVYIDVKVSPPDKIFTIEEAFSISINLYIFWPYFENFLRVPVNISVIILKDNEIDDELILPNAVQSYSLQSIIENDSIPGIYTLNISIISDYYEGNVSIDVEVRKKQIDINLVYDNEVDEDEDFDINWALENANFTGNRENMTLEIYVDGVLYTILNLTTGSSGITTLDLKEGDHIITYRIVSPFYTAERSADIESVEEKSKPKEKSWLEENWLLLLILLLIIIAMSTFGIYMTFSRRKVKAQRALESELIALRTKVTATEDNISLIKTQISQISGIYWILVIHSEQGTTMVEISDFRFKDVLGDKYQEYIVSDTIRDSALIGGFLTAIRNFSRETSGTIQESMSIFNSQTDYSTIVNDKEVHRRILEGADYFMAFMSSRETLKISDVLAAVNSKFRDNYEDHVKEFVGKVVVFKPFEDEVVNYLHNELRELEKRLKDEVMLLEHYNKHLKEVQEKIGIKKNI